MPTIKEYTSPVEGFQTSDRGTESAVMAGRRVQAAYSTAGDALSSAGARLGSAVTTAGDVAVKYVEHREVSQGAATYAKLNDGLTQAWNDAAKNADPNDPTVAAKFQQDVLEPALEKYREGFLSEGGQKFAEARVESLRNHMFQKTSADMSTLAAAAVSKNVRETANSLSNTAMRDPSAVPHLLEGLDASINGIVDSSPNIKGTDAARAKITLTEKMREDIVKAGAIGAIQQSSDPERTAQEWGERYSKYISGADLKTLGQNAKQQKNADIRDQKWNAALDKQAKQDQSDQREEDYLKAIHSGNPEEQSKVSTKAIVNDPKLTRQSKERMIGIVEREFKPETASKVSNQNAIDLLDRIRLPDGDPRRISSLNDIYQARIDGKLNKSDFEATKKEFIDMRTPEGERLSQSKGEFLKAMAPLIDKSNPLMGKLDPDGKVNLYKLSWDLDQKIAAYRTAGKNPYDLLDPSKPDYIGKPEALVPYQKSLQQSMNDMAKRLRGAVSTAIGAAPAGAPATPPRAAPVPRKTGESPAEYLKRTGNQ